MPANRRECLALNGEKTMNRSNLFMSMILLAALAGTGIAAAPNWKSPKNQAAPNWAAPNWADLTGDWYGQFASGWDRTQVGEVAMRVDFQDQNRFLGKLAMGRSSWEIAGAVDTFNNLHIMGVEPSQPDIPGAIIAIRGTVRFADPPTESDPPGESDPPSEIVAEYFILYSDGSMDMGYLELVPAVRTP
jgi:hypothetical protein